MNLIQIDHILKPPPQTHPTQSLTHTHTCTHRSAYTHPLPHSCTRIIKTTASVNIDNGLHTFVWTDDESKYIDIYEASIWGNGRERLLVIQTPASCLLLACIARGTGPVTHGQLPNMHLPMQIHNTHLKVNKSGCSGCGINMGNLHSI